ncbi:MAG TPA: PhoPQ-activated protein PqaA family protein [Candidatus Binatia bacterium]|jgi:PhoPQ-activated pathogenicity-related protein
MLRRKQWFFVFALLAIGAALPAWAHADLEEYLRKPEPQFNWKIKDKTEHAGDRIYDLHVTSQSWQGITWEHQLQVYQPANARPSATMLLWVTGGSAAPTHAALGMELARQIGAPVAFLYHIPNQPLLDGNLREDDLIAETFVRYLKTQDENWPLLFPMVKSVVKAMDVLQAFGQKEWKEPVKSFIVSGASKRGWTTWLTAAVDPRVRAIAPMVIDTLNMRAQMPKQLAAFGAYSARLTPYTSRGLLPIPETPEGQRLLNMVDPWSYRGRLALPKLIINGTNDFYWATDALNLYWNELPGNKWVLYVPNAGHDLLRREKTEANPLNYLITGLAAFVRQQVSGAPMPKVAWQHDRLGGKLRLTIEAAPAPLGARLWVAKAPTQDFRAAEWTERPVKFSNAAIVGEVAAPKEGYLAFYGELDYEIDGLKYHLSSQIQMAGDASAKKE